MAPQDAVAVLARSTGGLRTLSDFTDDRASLSAAIREAFKGPDPRAPHSAGEALTDLTPEQLQFLGLQQAVKLFAGIYERKAFLYFASHIAHEDPANRALAVAIANAANREVLSLYPIETASGGRDAAPHSGTFAKLANETAGVAHLDGGGLTVAIARVEHANSSYYRIQYYIGEPEEAGRDFHTIQISLKGASGALTYQGGYYRYRNWRGQNAEEQLREALLSGDPPTELPLSIEIGQTGPTEDKYGVTVKVTIPASEVFAASHGPEPPTFDFAAEVKDGDSAVQALRESVTIQPPVTNQPTTGPRYAPLRYQHLFELPPGTYALRLVARSAAYYGVMGYVYDKYLSPRPLVGRRQLRRLSVRRLVRSVADNKCAPDVSGRRVASRRRGDGLYRLPGLAGRRQQSRAGSGAAARRPRPLDIRGSHDCAAPRKGAYCGRGYTSETLCR